MKLKLVILIFNMAFFINCEKKETKISKPKMTQTEQGIIKTKGLLVCNKEHVNYKKIKKGTIVKQEFTFYNTGTELVELLEYEASCNCTELKVSKYKIKPKDSVKIEMVIETKDKSIGKHKVNTTIKTNGQRTFYFLSTKFEIE